MSNIYNLIAGGGNRFAGGLQQGLQLGEMIQQGRRRREEEARQAKLAELMPQMFQQGIDQNALLGQLAAVNPAFAMQAQGVMQGQQDRSMNIRKGIYNYMSETNQLLQNMETPEEVQQAIQYRTAQGQQIFGNDFIQMAEGIQNETGVLDVGALRKKFGSASKEDVKIGQYNPRDYTTDSWAQFIKTKDPSVLAERGKGKIQMVGGVPYEYDPVNKSWKNLETAESVADIESTIAGTVVKAQEEARQAVAKSVGEAVQGAKLADAEDAYSSLSKADLDLIYGKYEAWTPDFFRSQKGLDLIAQRDKLVGMLTLAARGELRGQGTITDNESEMLKKAVSSLSNPSISPELARKELDAAMELLKRNAGKAEVGASDSDQSDKTALPDGTVIENKATGEKMIKKDGKWLKM